MKIGQLDEKALREKPNYKVQTISSEKKSDPL